MGAFFGLRLQIYVATLLRLPCSIILILITYAPLRSQNWYERQRWDASGKTQLFLLPIT